MEAKDALVLEILARVSKGEGYQRLAASDTLVADVLDRYRTAEQTLQDAVTVECAVNDDENRGNWQLIYHAGAILLNHSGAVGFKPWTQVPPAVLLEALPLVSRLVSATKDAQNALQSTLLQGSARYNAQDPDKELPTLKGQELPAPEPEPAEPGIADPNEGFEGSKPEAEDIMAALVEPEEEPATPESVLADEILAGIEKKALDFEAPLPELKPAPSLPKAPKKGDSLPDTPAIKTMLKNATRTAAKKAAKKKR